MSNSNIVLIQYTLIIVLVVIMIALIYVFINRHFMIGYRRSKKLLKNVGAAIQNKSIDSVKDEVFRLVAKPSRVQKAINKENEIHDDLTSIDNEKALKFEALERNRKDKLDSISKEYDDEVNHLRELRELNRKTIDILNSQKVSLHEDIKELESKLADVADEYDKSNGDANKQKSKIESVINPILKLCQERIKSFSDNLLGFLPILLLIIFVVVDYAVGYTFLHEFFRSEIEQTTSIIPKLKEWGIALMLFVGALLAIEYARKYFFDVYKNIMVDTLKLLFAGLIYLVGFFGIIGLFVSTRIHENSAFHIYQEIIYNSALIGIWFLVVFVSSILIRELSDKHDFKPLISVLGIFIAVLLLPVLIFAYLMYMLESVSKLVAKILKITPPRIKRIERKIQDVRQQLTEKDIRISEISNSINFDSVQNKKEKNINSLELETEQTKSKLIVEFENKNYRLKKQLASFKNVIYSFRSGCDHAVNNNFRI